LRSTLAPPVSGTTPLLALDERWSLVGSKNEPAWIWVALDRDRRPVAAGCWGERREESGRHLWEQAPAPGRAATGYSDFWEA
jgi:IS1 family transposase